MGKFKSYYLFTALSLPAFFVIFFVWRGLEDRTLVGVNEYLKFSSDIFLYFFIGGNLLLALIFAILFHEDVE